MEQNEIKDLQNRVNQFIADRSWQKYHTPKNLAMSITIEAAELMELYQWISVETSVKRIEDEEFMKKVTGEIADILIYTLSFASVSGIDIKKAIIDKLDKNEFRFPKDKSYHY